MKIVGFNLLKINVERKEKFEDEKLSVSQNINIKDVSSDKILLGGEDAIKVKFNFLIDYSNNSAKLDFEGNVIILPEKDDLKQFLKAWKDKKIPEEFRIPIFNFIVGKCTIKALSLEDELALPLHFPMPRLQEGGAN
ncbi:MAG: hypothetical protein PHF67_02695 [Candidatus Nanoarchaeia archaeon]|nr:hypothetical protein [Candidatus Nanoarchaeia archaeon]